jgi:aspartyl-tRNA(Asn)/glutamyl-tRNA(Gln) amidotransferase subunit A
LNGIPIAVKDNFCTRHVRTTCASKMLFNYFPPYSATIVERLQACGAILLGKTNMDEFAMGAGGVDSAFGPVVNPWRSDLPFKVIDSEGRLLYANCPDADQTASDCSVEAAAPWPPNECLDEQTELDRLRLLRPIRNDWYVAGGSSSGSAVAVAVGACYAALGSDTGGSTRNPAARVGIVGFKPTYGVLSRHGLIPLAHSLDVPGLLGRTVDCVRIVFETMLGADVLDSTCVTQPNPPASEYSQPIDFRQIRVGIADEFQQAELSDAVREAWQKCADRLQLLGAQVERVSLPHVPAASSCYAVLNSCEVASNFACYDGVEYGFRDLCKPPPSSTEQLLMDSRTNAFGDHVQKRVLTGNYFLLRQNRTKYYEPAAKVRRLMTQDFRRAFDKVDVMLTPVTRSEATLYSEWMQRTENERGPLEDLCTLPPSLTGLPALSLPVALSDQGLPISLQLIGPMASDFKLLAIARALEREMRFPRLMMDD